MTTGYRISSITANEGAFVLGEEAFNLASGATGVGGIYRTSGTTHAWDSINFYNVVGKGQNMPTLLDTGHASPEVRFTGKADILGGTGSPIGDIRGDGTGFYPLGTSSFATQYVFEKGENYSGALYAIYGKDGSPSTQMAAKIGIGTNATAINSSGYYEGNFNAKNINQFPISLTVDTGNLVASISTGSGVYTGPNYTQVNTVVGREGNFLTTAPQIEADVFISGITHSILDINGNLVFPDYRVTNSPSFTFSRQDNIDVFGSYTRNFGVRTKIVNSDGGSHTTEFYAYGNTLSIDRMYVRSSEGIQLNQSAANISIETGTISSLANAREAQRHFSRQQLSDTGVSGYIDFQFFFNESGGYVTNDRMGIYASNVETGLDTLSDANFLGDFALNQVQGQHIRLYPTDFGDYNESRIDLDSGIYFKFRPSSKVGVGPAEDWKVGPYNLATIRDGQQVFYGLGNDLNVDNGEGGGTMFANSYSGSGVSGRMTDMFGKIYLVSGEGSTESCCTIEETLSAGNTATTDLIMGGSSVIQINSYIQHQGDTNTYFGFPSADTIVWYTAGTERAKITDDGDFYVNTDTLYVDRSTDRVGIGTDSPSSPVSIISQSSDDKCLDVYDHGDTSNAIVEVKGTANADGEIKVNSTDGAVSVKLSNESSRGAVESYNAAGDTVQSKLAADANGGIISTKASDGTLSTEEGSDGNKRGFSKLYNAAGDAAKYVAEVDSNDQGSLTIKDSAGADGIKAELSSSREAAFRMQNAGSEKLVFNTKAGEQSYADLPKLVFGKTAPTSNTPFEVAYDKAVISANNSNVYSTGSVIVAGSGHVISGDFDFIGGGAINDISGGNFGFIGGGSGHCITGSDYSSSAGGYNNDIYSTKAAFIGGGFNNLIESGALVSAIAGGYSGIITDSNFGFVGGGARNHILSGSDGGVIVGGYGNKLDEKSVYSVIGGGRNNTLSGRYSFVAGGLQNRLSGESSAILAGNHNEIQIVDNALVAGNYSKVQNGHSGAFVLSDASSTEALSTGANALSMHFENGVYVESTSGLFVNGNIVLTGESPEADTLQNVTTRGNTTTTSILSTGPHISGTTGLFKDQVGIGTAPNAKYNLHVQGATFATGGIIGNSFLGQTPISNGLAIEGNLGIGYYAATNKLGVYGNANIGSSYQSSAAPSNGLIVEGNLGIGTNSPLTKLDVRGSISGSGNFLGTGLGQRITASDGKPYLVSGDITDTDTNTFVTGASFGTSDGVLTLSRNDAATVTVDLDGRFTDNVFADAMNQGVASGDSPTFNSVNITGTSTLTVTGSVKGTGVGDRITLNGTGYLISGDVTTSELGLGTAATKDVGISNTNVLQANSTITNDDFLRVDGTQIEGRSASELVSDIGLSSSDSPTFNGLTVTGGAVISGGASFSGNVGIGTDSPAHDLEVTGNIRADSITVGTDTIYEHSINLHNDGTIRIGNAEMIDKVGNDLELYQGKLYIENGGNVGIGVTDPAKKLEVDGDILIPQNSTLQGNYGGSIPHPIIGMDSTMDTIIYGSGNNSSDIFFKTNVGGTLATRVTITNAGNLGIGTTSPLTELDVRGDISGSGNFIGTGIGNRITAENGKVYLVSGDISDTDTNTFVTGASFNTGDGVLTLSRNDAATVTTDLDGRFVLSSATGAAAPLSVGISNNDLLQANNAVVDNDFLRVDGTQVEGRSASEVLSDIGLSSNDSPTFNSLTVTGGGGISGQSIFLDGGNSSDMAINFAASSNGIYCDPVTQMRFAVDSASSAMVLSSNNIQFGAGGNSKLTWSTNNYLEFNGGGTKARLNSVGLGIGTTSPLTELDVRGDISGSGNFLGTGVGNRITNNGVPYLLSGDSPAETQTLQDVCDNGNTTTTNINLSGGSLFGDTETPNIKLGNAGGAEFNYGTSKLINGGSLVWQGGGVEKFRVTAAGNVGIGTSGPLSELDVRGDISGSGNFLGTGVGQRITAADGKPYLISGDSPAETQTLQNVCDNGSTTTTSVTISDDLIVDTDTLLVDASNDNVGIGTQANDNYDLQIYSLGAAANARGANLNLVTANNNETGSKIRFTESTSNFQGAYLHYDGSSNGFNIGVHENANTTLSDDIDVISIDRASAKLSVAGDLSGSASFLGTGVGNRITNNGTPYLLSGDVAAEADTLATVTARGNSTSTSIISTGPHISGISGIFSDTTVTPKIATAAGNLTISPQGSYIYITKGLYGSNVGVGYQNSAVSALKFFLGGSIDSPDIKLERDAAGQLALRNGSNAQNLRIYNTYTSATNFERGSLRWENDVFTIAAEAGSAGGTSNNLSISGGATVGITAGASERITILNNGLVGINDTSPTDYRLCVGGGIKATAASRFDSTVNISDLRVNQYIRHSGDTDTYINFGDDAISVFAGGVQMINFSESTTDSVIVNGGNVDVDFKVMPSGGAFEALKVQASDGFVGVHKGAPTSQLDVAGTGKFSAGLFVSGVPVSTGSAEADTLQTVTDRGSTTTTSISIGDDLAVDTDTLFVDASTDRVGINRNSLTTYDLEVRNGAGGSSSLGIIGGSASSLVLNTTDTSIVTVPAAQMFLRATGGFYFQSGTTTKAVLTKEGDFGIGTASPSDKFHVEEDGGTVTIGSPTTSYGGIGFEQTALTAANSALYGVASQTVVGVKAGGAIEMKIANNSSLGVLKMEQDKIHYTDGNFGIGTDSPTTELAVAGTISGVTGYYKDTLRVGDGGFVDFPSEYDTLQVGTSSSATNGHILVRGKESSITFRGVEGSDKAHTIKEDAGSLVFYHDTTLSGTDGNARFAIKTGQSYFTDLVGVQGNGVKPQFYLASIGGGASNKATHFYQPSNSADFRIALNGSQNDGTIGTDAFAIKSTYEVGIGTTNPTTKLDVRGEISGSGSFLGTGVGNRITNNGTPYLLSGDVAAEADTLATVTARGNSTSTSIVSTGPHISGVTGLFQNGIGINTTDVSSSLTVSATGDSHAGGYGNNIKLNGSNYPSILFDASSNNDFLLGVDGNGFNIKEAGSDTRLVIDNNGNVGIGTHDPDQTLHVKGIGMIEDTSSTAYGTLQFGTDTSRYIRGNSAELQAGSTIQQLHFQKTNAAAQIASSAADGTDAIQLLARTVHTSANIMEVVNGNAAAPIFTIDYTGNVEVTGNILGTGLGQRITAADGKPYLISGDVAGEADTLQTVTDRGATTTTAVQLNGGVVINEGGSDLDFRVEGDTDTHALFVEGSTNRVGLGTGDPAHPLVVVAPGSTTDTNIDLTDNGGTSRLSMGYDSDGAFINGGDNGIGSSELHIRATNNSPIRVGAHNGLVSLEPGPYDGTNKYEFLSTSVKNYVRNGADGASYLNYNFTSLFADTNAIGGVEINPYYSGSERQGLTILANSSTARVGVGTVSPSHDLHVYSAGNAEIEAERNGGAAILTQAQASLGRFGTSSNHNMQFMANNNGALTITTAGNVGIGTSSPTEALELSGSVLLGPESSGPGDTMPFLKIDGYDEHGIEMGWGTWTKWKITTKVNGQLEIYNTGVQSQTQQVSIGRQDYHKQGNLMVYSTGSVLRAGHNNTAYAILDIGVQDAIGSTTSYQGDAYIDVRATTATPCRFHLKRDGEFIASGVSVSGDVLGTGVGNRITNNHVPYLLSGDISDTDTNTFVTGASFNTSDGVLTLSRNDAATVTADLDGRFVLSSATGAAAPLSVGISDTNLLQANSSVIDNDFLRIDGTQVEGRSASEVLSDIGAGEAATLDTGIAAGEVAVFTGSVVDNDFLRVDGTAVEGRSASEVLSDIGGVADGGSPTFNSIYLQNTIYHDGDTDTRIDVSADTIQLATAGTTALTVASNSHVGIGTSSPNAAYKLHTQGLSYATGAVIGGSYAGQSPPQNGLAIEGKTAIGYYTTSNNLGIYGNASVGTSYITTSAPSNGLIVQGNVGVGNNAPQTELDVSGAIKGGFSLSEKSSDFTLGGGDNGNLINGTSTSFDQISISSDLGANFNCSVIHSGQDVEITGSSNMIINGTVNGIVTLASGYQPGSIVRLATNSYAVFGNLL